MTHGIHHVTAIAGPAQRNHDFYTRVLGQRRVKITVNFDDPGTYHFYFGDGAGRPGSIMTFFPWERAAPGRLGIGEAQETGYRVPLSSLGFWTHRFLAMGVAQEPIEDRFGARALPFRDPDGMRLALIGLPGIEEEPAFAAGGIPPEAALRGFHGVTLLLDTVEPTAAVLTDVLGFRETGREGHVARYATDAAQGGIVDLRAAGGFLGARQGAGSVHHVAFRAADDAEQEAMVRRLFDAHGLVATGQRDRTYFRSVYFRSPGGVLFEIATDAPGFTVDEAPDALGQALKLPPVYEGARERIAAALPEVDFGPGAAV